METTITRQASNQWIQQKQKSRQSNGNNNKKTTVKTSDKTNTINQVITETKQTKQHLKNKRINKQ